jgi:hypothetical protein
MDLTYKSDQEMVQYVSGWMFSTFGLRPALAAADTRGCGRDLRWALQAGLTLPRSQWSNQGRVIHQVPQGRAPNFRIAKSGLVWRGMMAHVQRRWLSFVLKPEESSSDKIDYSGLSYS